MKDVAELFSEPPSTALRQYEAVRACHLEKLPPRVVAQRFGYSVGGLYNLCCRFRQDPHAFLDLVRRPPAQAAAPEPTERERRKARVLELRERGLSVYDIAQRLADEGMHWSVPTIAKVVRDAGKPRLARRSHGERVAATRPALAAKSDCRALDLTPRQFRTDFGGLFLFAGWLSELLPDTLLEQCRMPGSQAIPAGCALRSLLALKLYGIGRPSHVMVDVMDPGLALFAGLNAIPKRSTLTEYTCRVRPAHARRLMHSWLDRAHGLGVSAGESFDLDFHTVPYHGDEALTEKHYVSRRSRRQRGVLVFLARDASARVFCYANATVRKANAHREVLAFADYWRTHAGKYPTELVFDSGLTTYAILAELQRRGIGFLTLRRRSSHMLQAVREVAANQWSEVRLNNVGRAYRNPRTLEQHVALRGYPGTVRQIAVDGLGLDKPVFLLTNQDGATADIIDRYARRMVIENAIAEAIDFFHMDALSATVPMKIDLDVQLTLLASILYRLLGQRIGEPYDCAKARKVFRDFVKARATIAIQPEQIHVRFGRRANDPYLRAANFDQDETPIPWLGNRTLRLHLG